MKTHRENRDKVRTDSVTFAVSTEEKNQYIAVADELGMNLSSLVRVATKDYIRRLSK